MKFLFTVASPEYLRYYDSVLRLLAERGHDVAIAVNHVREEKQARFDGLGEGVRVLGLVPAREDRWYPLARAIRGTFDFIRYLHPRFHAAPALRDRMKRKVLPRGMRWLDRIPSLGEGTLNACYALLRQAERGVPVSLRLLRFLRANRPDVLVVSPLIDAASDQVDLVRAARALGIRTAVGIASWDNLTNKGLLRVDPDLVLVWNEAQKREAVELHGIAADTVAVTGAQLFDRWFERGVRQDRAEFCATVGLPPGRPYVLYTASSVFIARSELELPFVRKWIAALRASNDPAVRDLAVLVRPHPYNWHAWEKADLSDLGDVQIWPRGPYSAVDGANRAGFFDSMHHSAAVVGVNTSAMIESAIVGRPVFSLTGEFGGTQEGTLHFHHLLPENGGFLRVASTLDQHVTQLGAVLRDPAGALAETQRFVGSFVRPFGLGTPCTPIVADTLERFAATPAPAPQQETVGTRMTRIVLRPLAALVEKWPGKKSKKAKVKNEKSKDKGAGGTRAKAPVKPEGVKVPAPVPLALRVPARPAAASPSLAQAFAVYEDVRDTIARVKQDERAASAVAGAAVPSDYWAEELGNIDYMAEASPLIVAKLRHHAFQITGLRPYDYRAEADTKRELFEARLRALLALGGTELVVPEHAALGGFGYAIDGQLFNLDTLKYLEVLVGMKRAGVLDAVREVKGRPLVWEIGGGWGGFAYQFKTLVPNATYVITDFAELFLFSAVYLRTVLPSAKTMIWGPHVPAEEQARWREYDFVFVPHTRAADLPGFEPDLLINVASFQEMTAAQVSEYAGIAQRGGCPWLYSLNRERSRYNAQLTSVSECLSAAYDLTDVTPLEPDYTQALKKPSKALQKAPDQQRAMEALTYRHLVGRLRAAAAAPRRDAEVATAR